MEGLKVLAAAKGRNGVLVGRGVVSGFLKANVWLSSSRLKRGLLGLLRVEAARDGAGEEGRGGRSRISSIERQSAIPGPRDEAGLARLVCSISNKQGECGGNGSKQRSQGRDGRQAAEGETLI